MLETDSHPRVTDTRDDQGAVQPRFSAALLDPVLASGIPGVAVAVATSMTTLVRTAGSTEAGGSRAIGPRHLFHIGSNTKSMTATLAGLAVDAGLLSWETTAGPVLGVDDAPGSAATLSQLLRHSAGILPLTTDDEVARWCVQVGDPVSRRAALADRLLREGILFPPGEGHEYSNGGYTIVAAMLEQVHGESWETLLRRQVFAPTGMDALVGWPRDRSPRQPAGHREVSGRFEPHQLADGYRLQPEIAPAGDASTTPRSYARFLQAHLAALSGLPAWLPMAVAKELHRPDAEGYACGWGVQTFEGATTSVHAGSAETFLCLAAIQPSRDIAVGIMANAAGEQTQRALVGLLHELLRAR